MTWMIREFKYDSFFSAKPATRELTEDIFNEPLFDKIIAEEKPIVKKLKVDVVPKEPEKNNASKDIPVVTTPIVEPASIIDDMNIDFNDFADSMEEEQVYSLGILIIGM